MKEAVCSFCGGNHYTTFCFKRPKAKIKPGKQYFKWQETRKFWLKYNPPDKDGFYDCYLRISPFCPYRMAAEEVTLDHVRPRSHKPELRHDYKNLRPCCSPCNNLKGSRSLQALSMEYPHLKAVLDGV